MSGADAQASLREMARVLRPGGRLVAGELGRCSLWAGQRRVKGWLGSPVWRRARFHSPAGLRRLAGDAGFTDIAVAGAVFYPPAGIAARLLGPVDAALGAITTAGAAFLSVTAAKPRA